MATAEKRKSADEMPIYHEVLDGIRTSDYIRQSIWVPYAKANPFIGKLTLDDALDAAITIGELAGL